MKKSIPYLLLALALSIFSASAVQAFEGKVGDAFPDFTVEGDLNKEQLAYLDASEPKVRLATIPGDYLLIEIFSMYCPICQREAPAVNAIYKRTLKHGNLRMIGIATGNTPFETTYFRDEYKIPFPLFHDEDFVVNEGLGTVGTPYFVLVKNTGEGLETVYIHEGAVEDWDAFWADIRKAAKF